MRAPPAGILSGLPEIVDRPIVLPPPLIVEGQLGRHFACAHSISLLEAPPQALMQSSVTTCRQALVQHIRIERVAEGIVGRDCPIRPVGHATRLHEECLPY